MIGRLAAISSLLVFSLHGSVIDSGSIFTKYTHGMGDADTWLVTMGSTEGNYAVQFRIDGSTAVSWNCDQTPPVEQACDVFPNLPPGYTATITGRSIGDYGASGSATVDGVVYPNVGFQGLYFPNGQSGVFYSSGISLQSAPFVLAPGTFSLPFTMTGRLRAATTSATDLLLSDEIVGSGTVAFSLHPVAGPGSPLNFTYLNVEGYPPGAVPPQMEWSFARVPEPATWLMLAGALVLIGASRRGRQLFQ